MFLHYLALHKNTILMSRSIDTWDRISHTTIDLANTAAQRQRNITSNTYCDLATQPALFRATYMPNQFYSEPLILLRGRQHKFSVFV